MEIEGVDIKPVQPPLFDLGESSTGMLELFPDVWHLAEMMVNTEAQVRAHAVSHLANIRAVRLMPLIAYLFITRTGDPDLEVRASVIGSLAEVLQPDEEGKPAPEAVRQCMTVHLGQMRQRQIFAMLQVLLLHPDLEQGIARLLNLCPYAGNQLADIVTARKVPLEIRRYAARLIGQVGYLDAIPALERLLARMEARVHGQRTMAFAPIEEEDEISLIPDIRRALTLLNSP